MPKIRKEKQKMNYEGDLYVTKDFYLACFLKSKDIKLHKVLKEYKVLYFYFEGKEMIKNLIPLYFNGNENVCAIKFVNTIRDLKALTYSL